MTWEVASGHAGGPLYVLPPSNLSPGQESVEFTNHLNGRLPHLPAQLNPPEAESPEQVEARIGTLERGVVIQGGTNTVKGAENSEEHPETPSVATSADGEMDSQEGIAAADDPGPLSVAFIGAGILALLGLFFGAVRGWHPSRAQRARL